MAEMIEDRPDDIRIRDIGDHSQRAATVRAQGNVDQKHTFQTLRPGQGGGRHRIGGVIRRLWLLRLFCGVALAACWLPGDRHDGLSHAGVWCKHAVIAGQVWLTSSSCR